MPKDFTTPFFKFLYFSKSLINYEAWLREQIAWCFFQASHSISWTEAYTKQFNLD